MIAFAAGFVAGAFVTLVALAAVAAAVNRAPAKREQVRAETVWLDGVDVTRYLDREGLNGGKL